MIGKTLNHRYKITDRIGKGAMGTVYRATDTQTRQEVAIKVISNDLAIDPEMLERFKREGEALSKLKHPNIVGYMDAFQHDDRYIIVMEYVPGGSLYDLIKSGPMPIEHARQIALDLCDALIRAHRLNIIHRDLKPENILMDDDGTPKLADFGVARLTEGTRMTRTGTKVGTPYYMAPEAWKGEKVDAQADIWSLGVILFEMLAGQVPFDGDSEFTIMTKVCTTPPPDLKKLRSDVPIGLVNIVRRMLTREKDRRYQTMRQVAVDLESSQLGKTPKPSKATRAVTLGVNTSSFSYRNLLIAGGMVVGAAIIVRLLSPLGNRTPEITEVPTENGTLANSASTKAETDGMEMTYIPDGKFVMGITGESDCVQFVAGGDTCPTHEVFLSGYWLDKTEVTNAMYTSCVSAGACSPPDKDSSSTREDYFESPEYENFPVIHVSWFDAFAYCSWAGRRLPSEAEWEKASRGDAQQPYPWGTTRPNKDLSNFGFFVGDTAAVGSYIAGTSPFGIHDMAGNVLEWVADYYDERYYRSSPETNPSGPNQGDLRVLRGGGWNSNSVEAYWRFKYDPDFSADFIGFRCAQSQ